MRLLRECLAVTVLLVSAATVLTWPLVPRLDSAVSNLGDPLYVAWVLAWELHALGVAPLQLFDANIFHPHRWTLAYSDPLFGLLPLAAPVRLVGGGPILTHNVVLVGTFPLVGLAMFLLVRHLTGHGGAGAVAGLLYAFSHYRFGHLTHVQLLSHEWLPLMLLGGHRAVAYGGRWRDVALAATAFALQALCSGYYAYFAAVAVGLFVAWAAGPSARPALARAGTRGLVTAVIAAALLIPAFLPYQLARREVELVRSPEEIQQYAAQPPSYLATPPGNRWLGELTARFRRPEGELFPGAVMLTLAAVGTVAALSRSAARGAGMAPAPHAATAAGPIRWPPWLDVALVGYLLFTLANLLVPGGLPIRLGSVRVTQRHFVVPFLLVAVALLTRRVVHGQPVQLPGLGWLRRLGWPHAAGYYLGLLLVGVLCSFGPTLVVGESAVAVPLYRELSRLIPGFDALRVPARFAVLVSTALAVLAGYGVAAIAGRLRRPTARVTALAALGGLAVLEAWTAPLSFVAVAPTSRADRWLLTAPSAGAVAVLPMYSPAQAHGEARRLIGSTLHWRPLVNGYSSFFPPDYPETVETLNAFPDPRALARLRQLGVRYVVVELGEMPADKRERVKAALRVLPAGVVEAATLHATVIYEVTAVPSASIATIGTLPPGRR